MNTTSTPLKTLLLNPPSFENFDGGASSRWPAVREIESYWYPVWLAYPAGLLEGSRLLDAPPHHVSADETIEIAKSYEFLVLFTSTVGWSGDHALAQAVKKANPAIKITFVGPPVTTDPDRALNECSAIDFVCRREFDFSVVEFANYKPLEDILGISYRLPDGTHQHNPDRPQVEKLDKPDMPWATEIYARDMDVTKYNVPFLLHPYVSLYSTRGCPAQCTFCLWPQTLSGHAWRKRSTDDVAAEMANAKKLFPNVKEFFFDDDTFNIQKERTIELCAKLKPLGLTWSCTSRVTTHRDTLKAMKDAGCRLLIVGFESGDPQILKNIKKGATVERAREFVKDCHDLGLIIHADFILGLPGETKPVDPQHHRLRQGSRLRNHPGLDRPRLPGHRVLRVRREERLHHQPQDGRRQGPPDGPHRIPRPAGRVRHGNGPQVLRRILLPPQGRLPRRLESDRQPGRPSPLCRSEILHEAARPAQQGQPQNGRRKRSQAAGIRLHERLRDSPFSKPRVCLDSGLFFALQRHSPPQASCTLETLPVSQSSNHKMTHRLTAQQYATLLAVVLTASFGDALLSRGMAQVTATSGPVDVHHLSLLLHALLNPNVIAGIVLLIGFFATYTTALSWADLTFVMPATAFGNVVVALISRFLLHESLSWSRWLGILLITSAVGFVANRPARTELPSGRPPEELPATRSGVAL